MSEEHVTADRMVACDGEPNLSECMERFAHHWLWVWIAGKWTDEQTCSTCGAIRTLTKAG